MKQIDSIIEAIQLANEGKSKLSEEVLRLDGMSSRKTRHFLNNLAKTNYLEIGVWKGSTFVAANYGNDNEATAIDNFSEFGNVSNELKQNLKLLKNKYSFIEGNCFEIDLTGLGLFDVYFYDGQHRSYYHYQPQ